jgi:hypothetical protein
LTPAAKHGRFEGPAKSAYAFERYDFGWEHEYMQELEADPDVDAWTKNHKIRIPYVDGQNRKRQYLPDFLLRMTSGGLELHEVKGKHLLDSGDTKRKFDAAKKWCEERGIKFVVVTKE